MNKKKIKIKRAEGWRKRKIFLINPFMVDAKLTQAFAGKIQGILIL